MCNKWAMTYKFPCVISPDDAMYMDQQRKVLDIAGPVQSRFLYTVLYNKRNIIYLYKRISDF